MRLLFISILIGAAAGSHAGPAPSKYGQQNYARDGSPFVDGTGEVQRGRLIVRVQAEGSVRSEGIYRLRSTIQGRIQDVFAKENTWFEPTQELGTLLTKELAAMIDQRASTPRDTIESRWMPVYQPTKIRCPDLCFVTKVYARETKKIKNDTLLFEAARKLRLVGRVRAGDTHWIEKGQTLTYWDKKNPKKKLQGKVEYFSLDVPGDRVNPGGTFTILLDKKTYLNPGTQWEGYIKAVVEKDALRVPTSALISYKGETFLAIRVSTGVTSYEETQINAGRITDKTRFLTLDADELRNISAYKPQPQPQAYERGEPGEPRKARTRRKRRKNVRPKSRRIRQQREFEPYRRRNTLRKAPEIDVFPEDAEVYDEDRFPSDIQ